MPTGVLEQLAEELGIQVEGLRETLLSSGDEALSPSYLTTDASGHVSAAFSGHISANGLDLPEGTGVVPTNDKQVRWLHQPDGAVAAQIYTTSYVHGGGRGPASASELVINQIDLAGNGGVSKLRATDFTGDTADLVVAAQAGVTQVIAQGNGGAIFNKLIAASDGSSDFIQKTDDIGWAVNQGDPGNAYGFNVGLAGTYLIAIFLTGYTGTAGAFTTAGVGVDTYDTECQIDFNNANMHMGMNPAVYTKFLTAGAHTLLAPRNDANYTNDFNDRISAFGIRIAS